MSNGLFGLGEALGTTLGGQYSEWKCGYCGQWVSRIHTSHHHAAEDLPMSIGLFGVTLIPFPEHTYDRTGVEVVR